MSKERVFIEQKLSTSSCHLLICRDGDKPSPYIQCTTFLPILANRDFVTECVSSLAYAVRSVFPVIIIVPHDVDKGVLQRRIAAFNPAGFVYITSTDGIHSKALQQSEVPDTLRGMDVPKFRLFQDQQQAAFQSAILQQQQQDAHQQLAVKQQRLEQETRLQQEQENQQKQQQLQLVLQQQQQQLRDLQQEQQLQQQLRDLQQQQQRLRDLQQEDQLQQLQQQQQLQLKSHQQRKPSHLADLTSSFTLPAFRVCTFNVLAEGYTNPASRYAYCRADIDWSVRLPRLLQAIFKLNADILCLQEVECNAYNRDFYPKLKQWGYEGSYLQKSQRKPDGVAIFFKTERFSSLQAQAIVFESLPMFRDYTSDNSQVGLVLGLKERSSGAPLIVGCTHLIGDPRSVALRELQAETMLDHMQLEAKRHRAAVIFCGDLNSEPSSSLYQVIRKHSLQLASAYYVKHGREPDATFMTDQLKQTMDYIWISAQRLSVVDVPAVPALRPMPNQFSGSDHVPLSAVLSSKPQ
eukprot:TRINITY_DN8844_c0_g1_i1.p1 TRINITY_DN8844_c0_g1~~TRINITY_DN8844_c0_g1_i1.p1  ORF type:complete len:520 (-),score=81.30 TRINITY_DN8844_c0_g1_i1:53-1612(-)